MSPFAPPFATGGRLALLPSLKNLPVPAHLRPLVRHFRFHVLPSPNVLRRIRLLAHAAHNPAQGISELLRWPAGDGRPPLDWCDGVSCGTDLQPPIWVIRCPRPSASPLPHSTAAHVSPCFRRRSAWLRTQTAPHVSLFFFLITLWCIIPLRPCYSEEGGNRLSPPGFPLGPVCVN